MSAPTEAQLTCLRWLRDRGGEGVIDRYGNMIARGEARGTGSLLAWLNLVARGHITGDSGRLYVTASGIREAQDADDRDDAKRRPRSERMDDGCRYVEPAEPQP